MMAMVPATMMNRGIRRNDRTNQNNQCNNTKDYVADLHLPYSPRPTVSSCKQWALQAAYLC